MLVAIGLDRSLDQLIPIPTAEAVKNGQRLHEVLGQLSELVLTKRGLREQIWLMRPIPTGTYPSSTPVHKNGWLAEPSGYGGFGKTALPKSR